MRGGYRGLGLGAFEERSSCASSPNTPCLCVPLSHSFPSGELPPTPTPMTHTPPHRPPSKLLHYSRMCSRRPVFGVPSLWTRKIPKSTNVYLQGADLKTDIANGIKEFRSCPCGMLFIDDLSHDAQSKCSSSTVDLIWEENRFRHVTAVLQVGGNRTAMWSLCAWEWG